MPQQRHRPGRTAATLGFGNCGTGAAQGHPQVGIQAQHHAAGRQVAVEGGDDGFLHCPHALVKRILDLAQHIHTLFLTYARCFLEVHASAESTACCAGEDDDAHLGIIIHGMPDFMEAADQLHRQCIAHFRTVQGQRGDVVPLFVNQHILVDAHVFSSTGSRPPH